MTDAATYIIIRRTRGASRNEKLEEWRRAHPEKQMRIVIPPGYIMPLECHVRDPFVYEAGIIVRVYAPLTLFNWHRVSQPQKQILLDHLLQDFDINDIDNQRMLKAILKHMGRLLKGYRYKLYSHWRELFGARGAAVARETPYRTVSRPDWDLLCNKYKDPAYQVSCDRNAQSR